MKPKTICKIAIDFCLTAGLLLLMAYELIGKAVHEWIGVGMILLFILHHLLNWNWLIDITLTETTRRLQLGPSKPK